MREATRPLIGLIPAAGRARRLGELPCSKEIFPIGFEVGRDGEPKPRPVIHGLLRGMASAGVERALIVLRDGKWDIPACLGEGDAIGLDLAYLLVGSTGSVPETLDRAHTWIAGHDVALGFPDILLEPADVWPRLAEFHRRGGADVSLGLFPTDQVAKADMVDFDDDGRIRQIVIKDPRCTLRWTWSIAMFGPSFRDLLHAIVGGEEAMEARSGPEGSSAVEPYVGDVVRAAVERGLDVRGLPFHEGRFLDVGTPEDLRRAVRSGSENSPGARSVEV
ncbi:MAG: dTDP-glucose pyrophosphorylase [Acidobacteriota bacterium]